MVLGYVMMGVGLTALAGKDIVYPIYKHAKNKKKAKKDKEESKDLTLSERAEVYTKLFTNMGIMKKSDWLKVTSYSNTECYALTKFSLSDSIPISAFIKRLDDIKNKLGEHFLEIYPDKTHMCFRCRKQNIPLQPFSYTKVKQTLVQLGLDLDNKIVYWDLTKDPHCGIFAESGSGKSRQVHCMICFVLTNDTGAQHYMIDLKNGMEFGRYKNLPNVTRFAKDIEGAKSVIADIETESIRRYEIMEKEGYTDYNEYIKDKPRTKMRRIYVWIDEIADLMDDKKANTKNGKVEGYDVVGTLVRLGRKVRAVGVHLCPSTQRPTIDFIPASLKSNLGCIIGMKVLNQRNSQLIIDDNGLEELEQSQAIGKLSSKMVFFRSFYMDNKTINSIIKELMPHDKVKDEPSNVERYIPNPNGEVIDVDYEDDGKI